MDGAAEVLVIILAVVLTVFLVLGIILTVILIKLSKSLQRIAEKADGVVGNVEAAAAAFRNVAGPLAAGKFFVNIAEAVFKKKGGKK